VVIIVEHSALVQRPTSYGVNLTVEELVFARGHHLEHEALDLAEDLYAKSPRR
jgi:hypothetical protein